jgi:site-specific DNA recombinase
VPAGLQPVDLVEAEIEAHYATVQFSAEEREQVRQAIIRDLGEKLATAQQEIERCQAVLEEIREQERKLLNMHYEDRISGELFDDEQTRIRERRKDSEALIARLSVRHEDVAATLDLALEILCDDLHQLYRRAEDSIRRLINQAIFNALYVCDETIPTPSWPSHSPGSAPYHQRRKPGKTPPATPTLPRQRGRSRPLPEPRPFPSWFD